VICQAETAPRITVDPDDSALSYENVTQLIWYHTSTQPDWPTRNYDPAAELSEQARHAQHVVTGFGEPRVGDVPPTPFIGPSRFGTLEVLAVVRPPGGVHIFHVMQLRESTRIAAGYERE
jgi:hypothetical protein